MGCFVFYLILTRRPRFAVAVVAIQNFVQPESVSFYSQVTTKKILDRKTFISPEHVEQDRMFTQIVSA